MNESIRRLEEKVAYLEHHVTQQDKVMLELTEELTRLRREVATLRDTSGGREMRRGEGEPREERPPHY